MIVIFKVYATIRPLNSPSIFPFKKWIEWTLCLGQFWSFFEFVYSYKLVFNDFGRYISYVHGYIHKRYGVFLDLRLKFSYSLLLSFFLYREIFTFRNCWVLSFSFFGQDLCIQNILGWLTLISKYFPLFFWFIHLHTCGFWIKSSALTECLFVSVCIGFSFVFIVYQHFHGYINTVDYYDNLIFHDLFLFFQIALLFVYSFSLSLILI